MGKGKQPVSSPEDSGGKSSEGLLPIVQGRTERPQEVAPKNSRNFLSRVFSAMVGSGSDTDPRMATSHINAPSVGEDAPPVDGHSNEVEEIVNPRDLPNETEARREVVSTVMTLRRKSILLQA